MSHCRCETPHEFRVTSENGGADHLYLRCGKCGGKAGRVPIDMEEFAKHITDPEQLDPTDPEVAESIVEHGEPTVSIHLNGTDTPFLCIEDR